MLSVAITGDGRLRVELNLDIGETHSRHLLPVLDRALEISRLQLADMDGFAVTQGPGSFTGLRIGMGTVKGLATAAKKPVVAVSSLEALARQVSDSPFAVCSLIDARKNEVYHACYPLCGGRRQWRVKPRVSSMDEVLADLDMPVLFVGNGAVLYRERIRERLGDLARFADPALHMIRAAVVARMAEARFAAGDIDSLETLTPLYVRRPDAEMKRSPRN